MYVLAATVSVIVYSVGTPVIFTTLISIETCTRQRINIDDKYKRFRCLCRLRSGLPWGFRTAAIRERLGLLVVGYDTHRGAFIMSWEPLIGMPRKLLITLVGSLVRDPYMQIMLALIILVFSLTLQALVQPYEDSLINALDVGSLLVLVVTQVISILYLYLDSVDDSSLPSFVSRTHLEVTTTFLLFVANIGVIIGLVVIWILKSCWEKCAESRIKVKRASMAKEHIETSLKLKRIVRHESMQSMSENPLLHKHVLAIAADPSNREGGRRRSGTWTWWRAQDIELGDDVTHPQSGAGVVEALSPNNDGKVHVRFSTGFTRSFDMDKWEELEVEKEVRKATIARLKRAIEAAEARGNSIEVQMIEFELRVYECEWKVR